MMLKFSREKQTKYYTKVQLINKYVNVVVKLQNKGLFCKKKMFNLVFLQLVARIESSRLEE